MQTVLTIETPNLYSAYTARYCPWREEGFVAVPEPYQAGEPTDICVWTGLTRWAVPKRHSIEPFDLPSDVMLHTVWSPAIPNLTRSLRDNP
jgi:hypothetical protein